MQLIFPFSHEEKGLGDEVGLMRRYSSILFALLNLLLVAFIFAQPVLAGDASVTTTKDGKTKDIFLTTIPASYTLEQPLGAKAQVANIGEYINLVYRYALGIIGIIATVLIMVGGLIWLSSAGNEQLITQGKEIITSAVIGLVIGLFSYSILYWINPKLLSLDMAVFKIPIPPEDTSISCTSDSPLVEKTGARECSNYPEKEGPDAVSSQDINSWITKSNSGSKMSLTFIKAIMLQESAGNQSYSCINAQSGAGACGLMQVVPDTAADHDPGSCGLSKCVGVKDRTSDAAKACCKEMITNPEGAICMGVRYLHWLAARPATSGGNEQLVAAAYNGGLGAIQYDSNCPGQYHYQCKGVSETMQYGPSTMKHKEKICQANAGCSSVSVSTKAGSLTADANGYCTGTSSGTKVYSYATCKNSGSECPSAEVPLTYKSDTSCGAPTKAIDGSTITPYHSFSEDKHYGTSTLLYTIDGNISSTCVATSTTMSATGHALP